MRTNESELERVEEEQTPMAVSAPASASGKTAEGADQLDQPAQGTPLTRPPSRQGSKRFNPGFPAPHGLEKVQLGTFAFGITSRMV